MDAVMLAAWWNPADWSQHTLDVVIALGTASAAIAAVVIALGTYLSGRRRRPSLRVSHDRDTDVTVEGVVGPRATVGAKAVYVRLAVTNASGKHAAEDVQVFVVAVAGSLVNFGPLGWTHIGESIPLGDGKVAWVPGTKQTLGPGMTRTVDLGHAQLGLPVFTLAVYPEPFSDAHTIHAPGASEIVLAVSPRNADARHFKLTLSDSGGANQYRVGLTSLPEPTKPPR